MRLKLRALVLALGAGLVGAPAALAQSDALDRSVLPIPEPPVPSTPSSTRATPSRRRASR